jgi:hypothetical protein
MVKLGLWRKELHILLAYRKGERLWFVYRKVGGLQRGGYTVVATHSKAVIEWPQGTVSWQQSCCHDYFGYRVCFASSGLGTREAESLPSSQGYGHSAQVECRSIVDYGPHILGVFGAGPISLLLWHIRRVEDYGLWLHIPQSTVSLLLWHIIRVEDTNTCASFNIEIQGTHAISVQGKHRNP